MARSSAVKASPMQAISNTRHEFTQSAPGAQPSVDDAMALVLAALSLLGLGIFGPGVANGIVSGGPQLGAGAVVGTGLTAGGAVLAGAGAARIVGGALMGPAGKSETPAAALLPPSRGPDAPGGGSLSGTSPRPGGAPGGGSSAAVEPSVAQSSGPSPIDGAAAATSAASPAGEPAWAKRLKRSQSMAHGVSLATHSIRAGDVHGAGASINLSEGR
ncbi:MAG: hypothetical protein WA156_07110 [Methylocystis silviterrae]